MSPQQDQGGPRHLVASCRHIERERERERERVRERDRERERNVRMELRWDDFKLLSHYRAKMNK